MKMKWLLLLVFFILTPLYASFLDDEENSPALSEKNLSALNDEMNFLEGNSQNENLAQVYLKKEGMSEESDEVKAKMSAIMRDLEEHRKDLPPLKDWE